MKSLIIATIVVCIGYIIWICAISPMIQDAINNIQPAIDNFTTITDQLK